MFDYDFYDEYVTLSDPSNNYNFMSKEEYQEFEWQMAEHEAEMNAESAWLRAAEAPTNDDYGFEKWEAERGCF